MKKTILFLLALFTMTSLWAQGQAEVKVTADCGDKVEMVATPETGYHFLEWRVNNVKVSTATTLTIDVNSDSVFVAVFEIDSFPITFQNYDGTELEKKVYDYGETPTYHGDTPTKPATAEWTYTFAGWDPTITTVTGEQTYVAQFDQTKNKYIIIFQNEDGSQLQKSEWEYGTTPAYSGTTPVKPNPDAGKTYSFDGWTETIVPVTGVHTYTAKFKETINQYTVTVSAIPAEVATVSGGGDYTYNQSVTVSYTITDNCYKFLGWYENNVLVSSDKDYTFNMPLGDKNLVAKFEKIKYTITIKTQTGDTTQGSVTGNKK
ncbi:MAG: InlB B-repeat-containing protein [Paludibacteraceae bacterium]|nr:InlB B-repeat-containing protein [Paludibacteraceae bacterium]